MHIILLNNRSGASRPVNLNVRWLTVVCASALILTLSAGALLGSTFASKDTESAGAVDYSRALAEQHAEVDAARLEAQRQLDAFAAQMAELQARMTRIDALGERLTQLSDIDASEFDFSLRVGQGGDEDVLGTDAFTPPEFMEVLDELSLRLSSREQQLEVLQDLIGQRQLDKAGYVSGRPVRQGYVTSPFGRRVHPLTGRVTTHRGIDFSAPAGSDVLAVAAGVITYSGWRNGYGNTVEVTHPDGHLTLYAHNQKNLAKVGDLVQRGQVIAKVGSTGRSTGNHVHFEVRKGGTIVNPAKYIARAADVNQ